MKISEELEKLKSVDIYSLMMFALFKMRNIPEYSTLSELVYLIDRESLLKLCEYFGGLTIKIPTIDELESLVYSLLLYQCVDIDKMNYDDTLKSIGTRTSNMKRVKADYVKLKELLAKYDFNRDK